MNRILTFHQENIKGNNIRYGPTYYIETDYEPIAVRLHVETASSVSEVEVNIFDDGVSIFADRDSGILQAPTKKGPTILYEGAKRNAFLSIGDNYEVNAEDFSTDMIETGSWVHCEVSQADSCKNLTVHLELFRISEEEEQDEE